MDKQIESSLNSNGVSVSSNWIYPLPIGSLCIICLNCIDCLFRIVCASAHNYQLRTNKTNEMLVSASWSKTITQRRSVPVPNTISVLDETPHIIESWDTSISLRSIMVLFVFPSSTKDNHHSCGFTLLTQGSGVIDSGTGHASIFKLILGPREWPLLEVDEPHIIFDSVAWISPEHNQMGLVIDHCVAIPLPWGVVFWHHFDHPPSGFLAQIQKIKFIFQKSLGVGSCTSIDDHLHIRNTCSCMGCSFWRNQTMVEIELPPHWSLEIIKEGFVGNDKFA